LEFVGKQKICFMLETECCLREIVLAVLVPHHL